MYTVANELDSLCDGQLLMLWVVQEAFHRIYCKLLTYEHSYGSNVKSFDITDIASGKYTYT